MSHHNLIDELLLVLEFSLDSQKIIMKYLNHQVTYLTLFAFLNVVSSTSAFALNPDEALRGIEGCDSWKDKGGQACDFNYGNHDFRIWRPQVASLGSNVMVNIKFDHKLRRRPDDHWYVSLINQNGKCSVKINQENRGLINDIRIRVGDERGWEYALINVIRSVAF